MAVHVPVEHRQPDNRTGEDGEVPEKPGEHSVIGTALINGPGMYLYPVPDRFTPVDGQHYRSEDGVTREQAQGQAQPLHAGSSSPLRMNPCQYEPSRMV